jgi:hypothetical protein
MNFKKVMAGVAAGSMVAAMAVVPAGAADEYHAYIRIQTGSWSFVNTFDDAEYGVNGSKNTADVTYDIVHGWSGNDLIAKPGTITSATFSTDGTYTVSIKGMAWDDSEFSDSNGIYREIGLSTDLPWDIEDQGISVVIDSVKIGDKTFDAPTVFNDGIDGKNDYTYLKVDSVYSDVSLGAYDATASDIEITFTVSGLGAAADDTTETGDSASNDGDTAPIAYLAAVVALAGVAMVASKKVRA